MDLVPLNFKNKCEIKNINELKNLLQCIIENINMIIILNTLSCYMFDNHCNKLNTIKMYKKAILIMSGITMQNENVYIGSSLPTNNNKYKNEDLFICTSNGNLYEFKINTIKIYTKISIEYKTIRKFIKVNNYPQHFSLISNKKYKKFKYNYKELKKIYDNENIIYHIDKLKSINAHNIRLFEIVKIYENILIKNELNIYPDTNTS
ncbi:hypothetical protein Indivirus_3_39 [Indivirus ILV1]|uniref:Uncharacterized protein n=1 Tax=Indivirus ILV1 TaxID=1977633 RepID=A0A1V0SDI8_9VIRU|nr:hypothetical protein Indivirus_3_39 [Indivirus ILV1]